MSKLSHIGRARLRKWTIALVLSMAACAPPELPTADISDNVVIDVAMAGDGDGTVDVDVGWSCKLVKGQVTALSDHADKPTTFGNGCKWGMYDAGGGTVRFHAAPDVGSAFGGWSDRCTGTNSDCAVTWTIGSGGDSIWVGAQFLLTPAVAVHVTNPNLEPGNTTSATATPQSTRTLQSPQYTWTSSNPAVASIAAAGDQATITALADGTTEITATLRGVTSQPVTVTVATPPADPWTYVLPFGQSDDYRSAAFADAMTGMILGVHGTVLRTEDGGITWNPVTSIERSTYGDALGISVPDPDTAYVVAGVTILRSVDGGGSWQVSGATQAGNSVSLSFVDGTHGWAVGLGGQILVTGNAGKTWDSQTSGVSELLHSVFFVDQQTGMAVGSNGTIVTTQDGGATWHDRTIAAAGELNDVWMLDGSTALAAGRKADGSGPQVFLTTDGGDTWNDVTGDLPQSALIIASGVSLGSATVFTVTAGRSIYRSEDGGVTWKEEFIGTTFTPRDVVMFDETTGVACGNSGVLHRQ